MDIGCGSGRLHLRYGTKTTHGDNLKSSHPLNTIKMNRPELCYDPIIAKNLIEVWGIDFSEKMITLAKEKLQSYGLNKENSVSLTFLQGSAFELEEQSTESLPVAVSLVNSISVMQGPQGAIELFKSIRRAVEAAKGIAIISCYQQEYIESYGLGQYESTLDVSGIPWWLIPDTFASARYKHIPKHYKRAYSQYPTLMIDVFDLEGNLIQEDYVLKREPKRTSQVIESGHIRTHTNYESHWYSYKIMDDWMKAHWAGKMYHIKTKELDSLRAEPAQMAILDCGNHLEDLFHHWELV